MIRCLVVLAAASVVLVSGCGGSDQAASLSKKVSARMEADATCVKAGVQEVAAERTRIYRCTVSVPDGRQASPCFAMVDGDLIDMTARADSSFDCSEAAR